MHYKNGREARVGDSVIGRDYYGLPFCGILAKANPVSETSNGFVVGTNGGGNNVTCVTIGELVHLDDAMDAPVKLLAVTPEPPAVMAAATSQP